MAMNAFEALAEEQVSAPRKARMRATEARQKTAAEKQLDEEAQLLKLYRRQQRADVRTLLEGPFGRDVRGLMRILRTMTLESGPALVTIVRESTWLKTMPIDHKWFVLRLISRAITRVREAAGLPPFDDGLPGEAPKAFEQIKEILELK